MTKGKTALITGASRGIGRAAALRLAKEGYHIAAIYRSNEEAAKDVQDAVKALGVDCEIYPMNVSDFEQAAEVIKAVHKRFGSIDVLVNNAGITKDTLLPMMGEDAFDDVIDVNLKGCFNMIRHTARIMMRQRSGVILNLSSVVGIMGNAGQANYSASKPGLIGLTKSTARELAGRGIRVNAIAPGFIETDMTEGLKDDHKDAFIDKIPLKRSGTPEDVAGTIAFLASDDAAYITGQVIVVDGGMVM